ncbi:PTS transporter subunit EIIC [[Haemophilus] felis]|uniref:PTS glucose transporter subunit IIBC n=1 Tax=[Haemophilus] felis TaxID=123822 RepID=A0A1T0B069_9PAST|nr:PTS transporter subunit EIIC [[Haemophilus] felis]NBI41327.1 PTS transporter subunit EIIC [[Haemophilus] felis]OOS03535.1 PTS glucose transporter subunit IIBC [[Haemophilus] felis]
MIMMKYLQNIGRALMLPVAALPAAAILMGIGYWIDPNGWGGDSQLAAFLIKSGAAIIDNMSILFAVGVAFGMSKDQHGSAALAGLVGFLIVTTLLSPGAVAQLQGVPADQVPAAFGKINNQFIGILVGVISAELYNRFHKVELPAALAFFSGKRLVPIVTSIVMIVVSFILMYVWPVIFNGLVGFGKSITDLGAAGAGIYGFLNRLLIPVGLHHALNSVFWFNVAGINDIPNFLGGAQALAEGKAVLGVTGMYQAGFFPVMMFGLPAAALAMYHSAKPAKKAQVASLMIAAALASFFTGVTEPLEFAFMFVAPVLYVIHALLTGVSVFIAASMQWMAGFGFSAGLVDMVLSSQNPLATQWYMLLVQGAVFFVIYYVVFRVLITKLNLKTPGRDEDTVAQNTVSSGVNKHAVMAQEIYNALGGKDNLVSIDNCITRLRLELKDADAIDEQRIKATGVAGIVKISKTSLQIIVGTQVQFVADALKELH